MEIIAEQQYMIQGATVTGKYIIELAQRHAEQLQKWRAKRSKAYHSKKKHPETKTDVSENEEVPEPETNTENVSEILTLTDIPAEAQQIVAETIAQTDLVHTSVSETNSEEKIEGETQPEIVSERIVQPDTQLDTQLDNQPTIVSETLTETRAQMEDTSDTQTIVSESSKFPAHIRTDFLEEYQRVHGELTPCHEGSINYRTEDGKIFYGIPKLL